MSIAFGEKSIKTGGTADESSNAALDAQAASERKRQSPPASAREKLPACSRDVIPASGAVSIWYSSSTRATKYPL